MSAPQTLFAMAGRVPAPPPLETATLVLIDLQNEYLEGPLALPDGPATVARVSHLLDRARAAGSRIVHIAHKGAPNSLFDRSGWRGAIVDALTPREGEIVIEKPRPNAFSGTDLATAIGPDGAPIILAGFMTHMCVSSTARAALDLGRPVTIASDGCATRDLPGPDGGVIAADELHRAELAALADRFACVTSIETIR